ncbi:hypothetical protein N7E81_11015 [Reichenbachiella carrageenanivorans]|uniref:Uncharacterized protein n=1 Tax=Reichenbachiella carrageenanivorans TaxID=2979869 RepID=A0ABY6CYP2_9BACT|nr:hypothetical protein [Reichenbachiella carrageenanivorans]UXX77898.1 hypothetical protein N7E81_11015 [Reichenbachiella carrageenanivorans]
MKISELKPTEARLLLEPYKLGGKELIISAISELIFFKLLKIGTCELESATYQFVELGSESNSSKLKDYHRAILNCAREHYSYYSKPIDRDSLLSPDRLVRDVYSKMHFNYFYFKKSQIMWNLEVHDLFRRTFPFYYLKVILTKEGKALQQKLRDLLTELERYYAYYKENEPDKIKSILNELGPNILLAYNIEIIARELQIWANEGFFDSGMPFMFNPIAMESINDFELPDFDMPSFELPSFELPDLGGEIPFFGND